tara:strand:+ start:13537 stop:13914 length:378 start_codon:yes stop_codon:yes gene_type:complete
MIGLIKSILTFPISIKNKENRKVICNAVTDFTPPPTKNDVECGTGSYCIRATVYNIDGGEIENTYQGYSKNMDVVKRTENACAYRRNHGSTCTNATISFLGDVENCQNHIILKNKNGSFRILTND